LLPIRADADHESNRWRFACRGGRCCKVGCGTIQLGRELLVSRAQLGYITLGAGINSAVDTVQCPPHWIDTGKWRTHGQGRDGFDNWSYNRRRSCGGYRSLRLGSWISQYRHFAFDNQIGDHSEHGNCRERNAETAGNAQLERARKAGIGTR
jgi:hypothetical protein